MSCLMTARRLRSLGSHKLLEKRAFTSGSPLIGRAPCAPQRRLEPFVGNRLSVSLLYLTTYPSIRFNVSLAEKKKSTNGRFMLTGNRAHGRARCARAPSLRSCQGVDDQNRRGRAAFFSSPVSSVRRSMGKHRRETLAEAVGDRLSLMLDSRARSHGSRSRYALPGLSEPEVDMCHVTRYDSICDQDVCRSADARAVRDRQVKTTPAGDRTSGEAEARIHRLSS